MDAPAPVTDSSMVVEALPENHAEFSGKARPPPLDRRGPDLGHRRPAVRVLPRHPVGRRGDPGAAPAGLALDAQCQLGLGLTLDLPLLGKVWNHDWPLYTWTGRAPASDAPAATSL